MHWRVKRIFILAFCLLPWWGYGSEVPRSPKVTGEGPIVTVAGVNDSKSVNAKRQAWLDETITLATDTPEREPRPALADFAHVQWVRNDRQRSRLTPLDRTWLEWQKRTGKLPPDFDQLPSQPFLPDPLGMRFNSMPPRTSTASPCGRRNVSSNGYCIT